MGRWGIEPRPPHYKCDALPLESVKNRGIIGDRTRIARFKGARPNQLDHDAIYRTPTSCPDSNWFRQSGGTVCHRICSVLPYRTPMTSYLGYLLYRLYLVCVVLIRSTNFVARTGFEPVRRINSTALKAVPIDQTTAPCYVLLDSVY